MMDMTRSFGHHAGTDGKMGLAPPRFFPPLPRCMRRGMRRVSDTSVSNVKTFIPGAVFLLTRALLAETAHNAAIGGIGFGGGGGRGGVGGGGGEGAAEAIVAGAKAEAMSAPEPFSPAPDPIEVEAEAISTPSSQVAAAGPPTISFFSPAPDPIEVEAEAISTPSSQVAGSGPPASFFSAPDPIEKEAEAISTPSSQVAASGPPVPDQLEDEVESIINYADKGLIPPVTVNVQTCVICPSPLPFVISPSGSP